MPNEADLRQRVREMIVEVGELTIRPEDINDTDTFFDDGLGLNSMQLLELVIAAENEFDVYFDEDDLDVALFTTVQAFLASIAAKRSSPAEP